MIPMLLMLAAADDALIAQYRARTRAEVPCDRPARPDDVVVCGRRVADRYRVPFVTADARDSVPAERARLLEPKMGGCGRVGAFFNDCGFVGVTTTVGNGGAAQVKTRKLAD